MKRPIFTSLLIGFLAGVYLGLAIFFFFVIPGSIAEKRLGTNLFYETLKISYFSFSAIITACFGALGAVAAYGILVRRLLLQETQKRRASEEVNKTKDEFISMVLHHLRTPLSGIRWSLKILLTEPGLDEKQRKELTRPYEENLRALNAVEKLVEASQASLGRIEYHFEVITIPIFQKEIEKAVTLMEGQGKEKGLKLEVRLSQPSGNSIRADIEKIAVIVQTLLENAIIYTPHGGSITVRTEEKDSNFFFAIADTGMGIPKKDQPRIFLQFFRAENARRIEPKGFGIGLFLAKIFIENHGGSIRFVSEEGKGTTFTFRLPLLVSATEKFLEEIS